MAPHSSTALKLLLIAGLGTGASAAETPDGGEQPDREARSAAVIDHGGAPVIDHGGAPGADPFVRQGVFPSRQEALGDGVKVVSAQRADLDHDAQGDELLLVRGAADALVAARHTEAGWRAWLVATAAPHRVPRWKPPVWAGKQVFLRYVVDVQAQPDEGARFEYVLDLLPAAEGSAPMQVFSESTPAEHRPAARQTWRFLPLQNGGILLETSDHRYRVLRADGDRGLLATKWSTKRPDVAIVSGKAPPQ